MGVHDTQALRINPASLREASFRPTGAIAETMTRLGTTFINSVPANTTGVLFGMGIAIPAGKTITSISFMSGSTPLAVGTHQWFCLLDSAVAVLRKTGDDTSTAWAANTVKTLSLSSTFLTTYSGIYYLGMVVTASTVPTLTGISDVGGVNGIAPSASILSSATFTDPASLTTVGTVGSTARKAWAWVS